MAQQILGRVRGVSSFFTTANASTNASTLIATSSLLPTTPLPVTGDSVLFSNGDLRAILAVNSDGTVSCGEILCSLKGAAGENGQNGAAASLATTHSNSLSQGSTQYAINKSFARPNLLLNSNFKLNSRGQDSYSGIGLTVDMWHANTETTTFTKNEDGTFNMAGANFEFEQMFEDSSHIINKSCMLTFFANNATYNATGVIGVVEGEYCKKTLAGAGVQVFVRCREDGRHSFVIRGNATNRFNVTWVKLEVGTHLTAYENPHPNLELLKCLRYLQTVTLAGSGICTTDGTVRLFVPWGVPMSALPTVTQSTLPNVLVNGSMVSATSVTPVSISQNGLVVDLAVAGVTANNVYHLVGGQATLSCELA